MNTWFWECLPIKGSSLPTSREGHSFTYNPSTRCWILFGGVNASRSNEALSLDTSLNEWKALSKSNPPLGRSYHISWLDSASQILYIFGGQGPKREPMYDMHALLLNSGKWIKLGPSERPAGRIHSAGCIFGNSLYMFGGATAPSGMPNNDLWGFNHLEINWSAAERDGQCPGWAEIACASAPLERKGHTMVSDKNSIYVFGGMSGSTYYNDLCCLKPPSFQWFTPHTFGQGPSPRAFHASTVTTNSKMIIFAGKGYGTRAQSDLLCDIYILDLQDLYWSSPFIAGFYPSMRYGAGIAWGRNVNNFEQILIVGGIGIGYAGMDVFNLQEKEVDSGALWHLEDVESGKLKFQASTQTTLLSNRRKIRDLEGQIYVLQEKSSFVEDDIYTLHGKLEVENNTKEERNKTFIEITKKIKSEYRRSTKEIKRSCRIKELGDRKIVNLENRISMLGTVLKEIESFLVVMDSSFYDTISINLSNEFRTFTTERMEEISERKKCHHSALAYLRKWYERSLTAEAQDLLDFPNF